MSTPKDGQHESTRYPTICRRYSAKARGWLYGYRLEVAGIWQHVHKWRSLDDVRHVLTKAAQANPLINGHLPAPRPLLAQLLSRYLATCSPGKPKVDAERALRRFALALTNDARMLTGADWLELLAAHAIRIEDIRTAKLSDFVALRTAAGAAPATVNREMNFVAAALHRAEDWYEVLEQWKPPRIPRLAVDQNRKPRLITDDEYARLCEWLAAPGKHPGERGHQPEGRKHVYWILRALLLTGARVGELYRLKWEDVDYSANPPKLRIRATKTARKRASVREIVISQALRAAIEAQRPYAAERQYIFTKGGNHSPKYYDTIARACAACGIPYGRNTANGLLLRFARHTTATELLRAGIPIGQAGRMLGHDPDVMLKHYDSVSPLDDARAIEALEQIETRRTSSAALTNQ